MRNKAIFLDRDGVVNREIGDYVSGREQFVFNEGLFDWLRRFRREGYLLVVVTNQGGVGRGLYSEAEVEALHGWMRAELSAQGIELADVFHCPHHPSSSECLCRKPKPLMVQRALALWDIDPGASFLVGDTERDMLAAAGAGVRGIRVRPNHLEDLVAHFGPLETGGRP